MQKPHLLLRKFLGHVGRRVRSQDELYTLGFRVGITVMFFLRRLYETIPYGPMHLNCFAV